MGPIEATRTCLARSFQFSGRAGRPEFWWFTLFGAVLTVVTLLLVDPVILGDDFAADTSFAPATDITGLLLLPATISVSMRRFHDCGWPGWPAAVAVVGLYIVTFASYVWTQPFGQSTHPIENALLTANALVLIAAVFPGQPGPNRYSPNPNEVPQ